MASVTCTAVLPLSWTSAPLTWPTQDPADTRTCILDCTAYLRQAGTTIQAADARFSQPLITNGIPYNDGQTVRITVRGGASGTTCTVTFALAPGNGAQLAVPVRMPLLAAPDSPPVATPTTTPTATNGTNAPVSVSQMRVGGADVGGHRVLMFDPQGAAVLADPLRSNFEFAGISQGGAAAGSTVAAQQSGTMTEASWSWIAGWPIYAGPNGTLTQQVPTSGTVQQVAVALASTVVLLLPFSPVTLAS